MNQENSTLIQHEDVEVALHGQLGVITLDRPEALNALTLEMVRVITAILQGWRDDSAVQSVLFRGAGDRAFCAGGDIKACYKVGMDYRRGQTNIKVPALFFAEEYQFNKLLHTYPKPVISFMNGITMGGGYGVAGNAKYRVVTDKTIFAMPEVAIGFFPDVASMYHLARFKGEIGRYLGLTGNSIGAEDAFYAGVGEYFIGCDQEESLLSALAEGAAVEEVLSSMSLAPDHDAPMEGHADKIAEVFVHDRVDDILKALEANGTAWAADVFEVMTSERSPASLYVTAEYFRRSKDKSIMELLDLDFQLAQEFIQRGDLYEGIRAAVIDRNYKPSWDPQTLKDMTEERVNEYFRLDGYDLSDIGGF